MGASEPAAVEGSPPPGEPSASTARIGRLHLRDFRNFAEVEALFPPSGVAIVGPNGSGKTNLLEAIYYLDIFRSFRGANDRDLVRFGQDVFRVEATLHAGGEERELAAAYRSSEGRKKVELDRREVERLSDAVGTLGAVVFSLDDVEIVRGSPSSRRRFLDILLSLVEPGYMEALQDYRSILGQRNEALKEGAGAGLVEAWTDGLVSAGARVMAARARWVDRREESFDRYYAEIAGGPSASMAYEPSVLRGGPPAPSAEGEAARSPADAEAWAERFRRALDASRDRERRREITVVGPQRDELGFRGEVADEEHRDLRAYGSGGQQRTAALALRLVEADSLADRLGREPVYLLDDVFAELDETRSGRLLRLLDEGRTGQVVATSPKPSELDLRGGSLQDWRLRDGRLMR